MSSIALRQHIIKVGGSPFAHNYLVFYDDDGNIVGQFHGLAQNPTSGEFTGSGRSSDYLKANNNWNLYRDGQPEKILWQGSHDEALERWQAAKDAGDEINNRNLTYNFWGSDLNGPRDWDAPVPPVRRATATRSIARWSRRWGSRCQTCP